MLRAGGGAPGLSNAANVAIAGGTITGTNVPYVVAKWGVPFIVASTGTMGNNGAISGMTALPATYSSGAWLYLPAGAVAAGVPAAASWLWFVASSTTAGTVYNSTYTTGVPVMGTQTAFSTTGPGAFTGVTTLVVGPQITIPANALAANGHLKAEFHHSMTNNANAKSIGLIFGGSDFSGGALTLTSAAAQATYLDIWAEAINMESGRVWQDLGSAVGAVTTYNATGDLTTSLVFQWKITRGTATDSAVLEWGKIVAEN